VAYDGVNPKIRADVVRQLDHSDLEPGATADTSPASEHSSDASDAAPF